MNELQIMIGSGEKNTLQEGLTCAHELSCLRSTVNQIVVILFNLLIQFSKLLIFLRVSDLTQSFSNLALEFNLYFFNMQRLCTLWRWKGASQNYFTK